MLYGQDLQWGTNVCSARAWGRAGERSCHGVWLCMFCVDDCIMTSTHCVCMFVVHCIFYASLHWHSCFHHTSVIFKWIAQYSNHLTHGGHVCVCVANNTCVQVDVLFYFANRVLICPLHISFLRGVRHVFASEYAPIVWITANIIWLYIHIFVLAHCPWLMCGTFPMQSYLLESIRKNISVVIIALLLYP